MYTVIGKSNCPQCNTLKSLFASKHVAYTYQEIGKDISLAEVKGLIPKTVRSVPILLDDGEFIGGVREAQQIISGA